MSKKTKKPWQGRFTEDTNEFVEEFTASIKFDQTLAIYDIRGSLAHAEMLASEGIILKKEGNTIIKGLKGIEKDIKKGNLSWSVELEYIHMNIESRLFELIGDEEFKHLGGVEKITQIMLEGAKATCDFYIEQTPTCGVTYWDTGAPNLYKLGDYLSNPADPFNNWEPVDSSAAAIGAQGLLRLGNYLINKDQKKQAKKYWQAGLTVFNSLLQEPYLSTDTSHHGLLLHTIYHQPNGWDHIPKGSKIANGESCMWGDYHFRELAIYVEKIINSESYYQFTNCVKN